MKQILITLAIAIALPIAAQQIPPASPGVTPAIDTTRLVPLHERCHAITKKGTRCKRYAKPGSLYCTQHKNYHAR